MISRSHRFHGYNSLRYVYTHGQTIRGPLCALKYVTNPKRKNYRLAIVVSKKVNTSAVIRNRIRRRLYEAFRQHETRLSEPYDMVVTVFSDKIVDLSAKEIERLVRAQMKEGNLIH